MPREAEIANQAPPPGFPGYLRIRWISASPSGKTARFLVVDRHGNLLGTISWHGPWRQYVFAPGNETIWSHGCLAELQSALKRLTENKPEIPAEYA
jgi:hypothetical protein